MDVVIRALRESELDEADRIRRLAFGTFAGMAEPLHYGADVDYVRTRWKAEPSGALAAHAHGRLVGSNFITEWGSVGFFGPLTVHPDFGTVEWGAGFWRRRWRCWPTGPSVTPASSRFPTV